jgi:hypothetical protein
MLRPLPTCGGSGRLAVKLTSEASASESACVAACARPFVALLLAWWMGGHGLWLLAAQTGWMFRVAVMDRGQWRAGKKVTPSVMAGRHR